MEPSVFFHVESASRMLRERMPHGFATPTCHQTGNGQCSGTCAWIKTCSNLSLTEVVQWQGASVTSGAAPLLRKSKTCAVVGESGGKLQPADAARIDGSDYVIRTGAFCSDSWAGTRRHVGERTTHRVVIDTSGKGPFIEGFANVEPGVLLLVRCKGQAGWLSRCWKDLQKAPTASTTAWRPHVQQQARLTPAASMEGDMAAVRVALELCEHVTVWGYGRELPRRTWLPRRARRAARSERRSDLLAELEAAGKVSWERERMRSDAPGPLCLARATQPGVESYQVATIAGDDPWRPDLLTTVTTLYTQTTLTTLTTLTTPTTPTAPTTLTTLTTLAVLATLAVLIRWRRSPGMLWVTGCFISATGVCRSQRSWDGRAASRCRRRQPSAARPCCSTLVPTKVSFHCGSQRQGGVLLASRPCRRTCGRYAPPSISTLT